MGCGLDSLAVPRCVWPCARGAPSAAQRRPSEFPSPSATSCAAPGRCLCAVCVGTCFDWHSFPVYCPWSHSPSLPLLFVLWPSPEHCSELFGCHLCSWINYLLIQCLNVHCTDVSMVSFLCMAFFSSELLQHSVCLCFDPSSSLLAKTRVGHSRLLVDCPSIVLIFLLADLQIWSSWLIVFTLRSHEHVCISTTTWTANVFSLLDSSDGLCSIWSMVWYMVVTTLWIVLKIDLQCSDNPLSCLPLQFNY